MSDFFSDPKLFAPLTANRARNERFVFVIVFVLGECGWDARLTIRRYHWRCFVSLLVSPAGAHHHRDVQAPGHSRHCAPCPSCQARAQRKVCGMMEEVLERRRHCGVILHGDGTVPVDYNPPRCIDTVQTRVQSCRRISTCRYHIPPIPPTSPLG